MVFFVMTEGSVVSAYQRFTETCHLHFHCSLNIEYSLCKKVINFTFFPQTEIYYKRLALRIDGPVSIRALNLWSVLYLSKSGAAEQQCVLQDFGSATPI